MYPQGRYNLNFNISAFLIAIVIIGFCLLKKDMKKNVDSPCRVKVGIMEKWSNNIRNFKVLLIPGISSPISEWTEQEISTRNENLAKIFSETIWPVN